MVPVMPVLSTSNKTNLVSQPGESTELVVRQLPLLKMGVVAGGEMVGVLIIEENPRGTSVKPLSSNRNHWQNQGASRGRAHPPAQ
jgi:hypothetical protein